MSAKKIIHHHWWLSMLTHILLHVCVFVCGIYTQIYTFYIHTEACVFLFIFFKNTDGFINISRIHFFHLEKQQQEKQHLMMNMYTFSRHAAFFCTHTCEQISHKQNGMIEKKMWKFTFGWWFKRFSKTLIENL